MNRIHCGCPSHLLKGFTMRVLAGLLLALVAVAEARAVPTFNNASGFYHDDFGDGTGVPGSFMVGTFREGVATAMTLSGSWVPPPPCCALPNACSQGEDCAEAEPPACCAEPACASGTNCVPPDALTGSFSTVDIGPISFDAWRSIYIEHSELVTGQIEVYFDALPTGGGAPVTFGPLPRLGTTPGEAPYTLRYDISGVSAATYKKGRVRVVMTAATPIKPRVSTLKVTWRPIPFIRSVLEAAPTVCSNGTLTLRDQISVSHTDATHFLALIPGPDGVVPASVPEVQPGPFTQNDRATFTGASDGGLFHAGPGDLVLAPGVVVPEGHVYWYRPTQPAGSSFVLSATFRVPQGLLDDTTYAIQGRVRASNMPTETTSNTVVATVDPTLPSPWVARSVDQIYRINGVNYSYPNRTIKLKVTGRNYDHPGYACAEVYYQSWIWDDLSPLDGKIQTPGGTLASGITNITGGGQTSGPAGTTTWDGVVIPPNVVFWDLRDLQVGEWFSFSYDVTLLEDTDHGGPLIEGQVVTQCAALRSDFRPQLANGCESFTIGVPDEPTGIFALGDGIRGSVLTNASAQDNETRTVEYGERYALAMYAVNRGVSALHNVVMLNRIPDAVTFDSAFIPAAANGRALYYIGTGYPDPSQPPPLDIDGNPVETSLWLTTPPSDKSLVRWVMVQVPALGSSFFPGLVPGAPTSVTAQVYVTVNQPAGACDEFLVHDRMVGRIYGYITPEMTVPGPPSPGGPRILPPGVTYTPADVVDSEWAEVRPRLANLANGPSLTNTSIAISPNTIVGSGVITLTAYMRNQQPGGAATGPLLDPRVVINVPRVSINGQPLAPLTLAAQPSAPGALSIDTSQLGTTGQISIVYPTSDPGVLRSISVPLSMPKGYTNGAVLETSLVATGRDAYCGPTAGAASNTAVLRGEPSLYLSKVVDFSVGGPGSELEYTLTYANLGMTTATGVWIIDRVPDAVTFTETRLPPWVQGVRFSTTPPPVLPDLVSNDFLFNSTIVTGNFQEGTYGAPDGDGFRAVTLPPGMSDPRWIAWHVVDPRLASPLLVTDEARQLKFGVVVKAGVPENTFANNDVLGFASGLLQTIGRRAVTIISPEPSIRVGLQCGADVLAGGEPSFIRVDYYNDSANDDHTVTIDVALGGHDYLSHSHSWNTIASGTHGTADIVYEDLSGTLGVHRFTIVAPPGDPLGPSEGGTLIVHYEPGSAAATGDVLDLTVTADALNEAGTNTGFGRCQTLISNPDIRVVKSIDQADPPSGTPVTFTIFVQNAGAHWARDVVVTDVLPPEFVYTGPATVQSGWTGSVQVTGSTLTWSNLAKVGVTPPPGVPAAGFIPGGATVALTFKANVANVGPDRALVNCASATTTLIEDDPDPLPEGAVDDNVGCAHARTPLPDLVLTKSVQTSALPGDRVTWTLTYRNASRELAVGGYIVDALPFAPSDAWPTAAAARYAGFHGQAGEVPYFSAAPRNGARPAFNPGAPNAGGWSATPTSPVNWIAIKLPSPIAALSTTRRLDVDLELLHPVSGNLPEAGSRFDNCAEALMGGPGSAPDQQPANNAACAAVGTPGIDLALAARCEPSGDSPGLRPEDPFRYTLTVTNTGTTIAYGVRLTPMPGVRLVDVATTALTAQAVDAGGQPVALRDEAGDARTGGVAWSAQGGDWLLGSPTVGAPDHYRTVGLPPLGKVSLTFAATIDIATLSGEVVTSGGHVAPDYGLGYLEGVSLAEEVVVNNAAACDVTTWRPDIVVAKDVQLRHAPTFAPGPGPGDVGDRLHYTLTLANIGLAAADDPRIEDFFPTGTTLVGQVTGDLAGAVLEYADPEFNWSQARPTEVIGLRVRWSGDLNIGGDGTWVADLAEEFADGGTFVGTEADPNLEAVVPTLGPAASMGCSSGEAYTVPAGRTYTHWANFSMSGWSGLNSEFVYAYPEARTGCCLETFSSSWQLCDMVTSFDLDNWQMDMDMCDFYYANDVLMYPWAQCICNENAVSVEGLCRSQCQMNWIMCLESSAMPSCQSAFSMALSEFETCMTPSCGSPPTSYCHDPMMGPVWYDGDAMAHWTYLETARDDCEADFTTAHDAWSACPEDCGSEPTNECLMNTPPSWTDASGMIMTPSTLDALRMQCQDDYQMAQADYDACMMPSCGMMPQSYCQDTLEGPTWIDSTGMTQSGYVMGCSEYYGCYDAGGGPCLNAHMNAYEECIMSPGMNVPPLAPYHTGTCGAQPAYPCFDLVGPPPEERCDTGDYCSGASSSTSSYTSPIIPAANGSVRIQTWTTLTAEHDLPPGALELELRTPEGAPIPGFTGLVPDAFGQVSLVDLLPTTQSFRVHATFEAEAQMCFVSGDTVDLLGWETMMSDGYLPPASTIGLDDGTQVRIIPEPWGDSAIRFVVLHVADPNGHTALLHGFNAPNDVASEMDRLGPLVFDAAPDGTIVGPQIRPTADAMGTMIGVGLVDVGSYAAPEEPPTTTYDPAWGQYLPDNFGEAAELAYVLGARATSRDFVVGSVSWADQEGWTACNQALVDACDQAVMDAEQYYEKVTWCAQWLDCLMMSYDECDPEEGAVCPMSLIDPINLAMCSDLDHEDGCVTDTAAGEFWDYESELQGGGGWPAPGFGGPPYAEGCDVPSYWGERSMSAEGQAYLYENFFGYEPPVSSWDFGACDREGLASQRRPMLATYTRTSNGWRIMTPPVDISNGELGVFQSSAVFKQLLDLRADGRAVLLVDYLVGGGTAAELVVWSLGADGSWGERETVGLLDNGVFEFGTHVGGISPIGDFVWTRVVDDARVWRRVGGAYQPIALPGGANTRVLVGDAGSGWVAGLEGGSTVVRWRPMPDGSYLREVMPAPSGLASPMSPVPLAIGADGTVVGRIDHQHQDFPELAAGPSSAGFVWRPDGSAIGLHMEAGVEASAQHVLPDGRVFGYYAPVPNYAGVGWAMPAYGPFVYSCDSTARPSLDRLAVRYDPADAATIEFDLAIDDLCQPGITNTVSATNDIAEITLGNNSAQAPMAVNIVSLEADVAADKVAVGLDDVIAYTFSVKNRGPGVARDVVADGTLPAEVALVSGTVDRLFPEIQPGQTQTWSVTARVTTNAPNLALTAAIATDTDTIECDVQKTGDTVTSLTGSWPNIRVAKTGPATAVVSTGATPSTITYTLTVTSDGNDVARAVTLTDTLPPGVVFVSASPTATPVGGVLTWSVGDLAPGASASATVTLEVPGCASAGLVLLNGASAASTSTEANLADNVAAAETVLLQPGGRLKLDVDVDRATALVGERLWYTVRYWNEGSAPVTSPLLTVPLPSGATYVAGSGTGGPTPVGGALVWSLGTLGLGASGSVAFAVDLTGPAGTTVTAADATLGGTGACQVLEVMPTATTVTGGLEITKRADQSVACATTSPTLGWSITVVNRGATPIPSVVVRDTVPAGTSYVGGSITGLGPNAVGAPSLEWQLGTLAPGRGVTVGYRTSVPGSALALVSNTATVSGGGVATTTSAEVEVLVDCGAAVSLQKAIGSACALGGTTLAVTLTARNRTNAPVVATLTDLVPASLEIVDRNGAGGTGQEVVFAAVSIPAQGTTTRSFTVRVAAGVSDGTPIPNLATLTSAAGSATSNEVMTIPITCAPPTEPECQTVTCSTDGLCVYPSINQGADCSDDSACTEHDVCVNGACVGTAVSCDDMNPCSKDTCDPVTGCRNDKLIMQGVACIDGNACTQGDVCDAEGHCVPGAPRVCNDGNGCTNDSCDPASGCVFVNNTLACSDNNPCTSGDTCGGGACQPGGPKICNDNDPCTDDSCNPITNPTTGCVFVTDTTNACNDGNWCTLNDSCATGTCVGAPRGCNDGNPCTLDRCDAALGRCVYEPIEGNLPCDDNNECTTMDACSNGACTGAPVTCGAGDCAGTCERGQGCVYGEVDGSECDDGDVCTEGDTCSQGACQPGMGELDCDDQNDCTVDTCGMEGCVNTPQDALCDDGIDCTVDICDPGEGCVVEPVDEMCDDSVDCTSDSCDAETGCQNEPDDMQCDDSVECTSDSCDAQMGCQNEPVDEMCDDSVECTSDSCDAQMGCQNEPDDMQCDDAVECTSDSCDAEMGCQHEPDDMQCDDSVDCTSDTCDAETGCEHAPDDMQCDDAVGCTIDTCDAEMGCVNEPDDMQCDDAVDCTVDMCDAEMGCVNEPDDEQCDDGNDCTIDTCSAQGCAHIPVDDLCDDGVACTVDTCGALGCETDFDDGYCDDGVACTIDTCSADGCETELDDGHCDDGIACTIDSCGFEGCETELDDEVCDDGVACTIDTCTSGGCEVEFDDGACDDGVACTIDTCGAEGCELELDGSYCDDGVACTVDVCTTSGCEVTPDDELCVDTNPCTEDLCSPDEGCVHPPNSGNACSDDDDCTTGDVCVIGACVGDEIDCDDGDACTADACEDAVCRHVRTPLPGVVDDDCDGVDDDCDGTADEDYLVPTTCGVGACAGQTGVETCLGGDPVDSCDPFAGATAERCDGEDNDCDGHVDNGFLDQDCGELVIYLIVTDDAGEPVGTARCFQRVVGGAVRCQTDPDDPNNRRLEVWDDLICPQDPPTSEEGG